ncbi:ER membrane protein complex subunit 2 [[Candida] jaroonii]|uniref:ER membrane protein complex subunit 2 n=1 Tax=[Candida] jaroonii TaxID=467808 RepID=A0ACA9XZQ8_9ASCO|nr:ER membrane protein complex subunit 2 [[Candida] jaroonii]
MDLELIKKKLLTIHSSGIFATFDSQQVHTCYNELKQLLISDDTIPIGELYNLFELHVYLSLITGHDVEAKSYIDRIVDQFGSDNSERINLLKAIYFEAIGSKKEAAGILSGKSSELNLTRRLATLSRSAKENTDYIKNLVLYLDLQPSDLIAWAELSGQYESIGHYDKAIFCLKEVLIQEPFDFHTFYKVGLLNYYLFIQKYELVKSDNTLKKEKMIELVKILIDARNNYLRTIEICKDHPQSWLGIYILCNLKFIGKLKHSSSVIDDFIKSIEKLKHLSEIKVRELTDIIIDDIKISV